MTDKEINISFDFIKEHCNTIKDVNKLVDDVRRVDDRE